MFIKIIQPIKIKFFLNEKPSDSFLSADGFFIFECMKTIHFLFFVLIVCACSCKTKLTGKKLMPEVSETDSVEVIFFKDPENQRFFTYLRVTDKKFIYDLVTDLSDEVQPENSCIKEGKIYCFKNGQIFNTVYFAYTDTKCSFLRYIKNGNLYCFPISEKTKKKLSDYKKTATEPVSADSAVQNNEH
jgi:hypothetical protein